MLKLTLTNGATIEADVRQIAISDYPKMLVEWASKDETKFVVNGLVPLNSEGPLPAQIVPELDQDSYDLFVEKFREANRGFYKYCYRTAAERNARDPQGLSRMVGGFTDR